MANELQRSKQIDMGGKDIENEINKDNLKLLQKYKRDMEIRELSPKTIYNYETDIIAWLKYIVKKQFNPSIKELTEDDIEEFFYFCKQEGNNTERMKRRMSSISAFYKFLRRKKEITENPCEFIPRPKKGLPVVTQTFLTPDQVNELIKKLEECDDLQLRTYAMFSLSTMARVNAVSSIQCEQIDFEERVVEDVLEKEGKIVNLYFSDNVKYLLLQLKKYREENNIESPYVFITKYNGAYDKVTTGTLGDWTRKCGEMINVLTLHPHDWRHSGSQLLSLNGCPIEKISELLNHSGLDVTKNHYLRQDKKKIRAEKDKYTTQF